MPDYYEFDENPPTMDVLDGELVYWWQDNTVEGSGRWVATPDYIEGETVKQRVERFEQLRLRSLTPEGRAHSHRADQTIAATRWLDEHSNEPPCLRVRCAAKSESGKPCRDMLAAVWHTPTGYLYWGTVYPFVEANIAHMNDSMKLRADGDPFHAVIAEMQLGFVGAAVPLRCLLSNPSVTMPADWFTDGEQRLLVGCEHHGNVAVPISMLITRARSNRKSGKIRNDLSVNAQDGPVL